MADLPSTPADGNVRVVLLTVPLANPLNPTVAELTAGTSVDISLYLTAGGWAPTQDQATISDDRLASTQVFGQPGRKTLGLGLTVIDNTNSPNAGTYNKAVDTLVEGAQLTAIYRPGIQWETPFAAGQKVTPWPFKPGMKNELPPEANSVIKAEYPSFVTGNVVRAVAIAGTAPAPSIASALPSAATAGALVTITGDFFTGVTAITFGAVNAPTFTVVSATKIVVVMPAGSAGSAAIVVTSPAGASTSFAYTRGA